MKYTHKSLRKGKFSTEVGEDQYVHEAQEFTVDLKEYNEALKKLLKAAECSSPSAVLKEEAPVEIRKHIRQGSCNWCKKQTVLLDFSSFLDGREIYCTGLCSEKCFTEAAKQIVSVESGNNKPRYIGGNRSVSQRKEDSTVPPSVAPVRLYPAVTNLYMIGSQGSSAPIVSSSNEKHNSESACIIHPNSSLTRRDGARKDTNSGQDHVEIFLNKGCYCGPYLDSLKLEQMNRNYRGSLVTVLKNVLEDTITCAVDSKTVFGFLKPGCGNCTVTTTCNDTRYQCRLNTIDNISTFWCVLKQFSDNLRCCANLFSSVNFRLGCSRCSCLKNARTSLQLQIYSNKNGSLTHSVHSPGANRAESKIDDNELHKPARPNSPDYKHPNSCDFDDVKPRRETLYQEILHQNLLSQESLKQEPCEQDSMLFGQHSLQPNSFYEAMRRSFPYEKSRGNIIHPVHCETKYGNDKENDPIDEISSVLAKRKWVENIVVSGVELITAPKTWNIEQVISFILQTDLKPNVDKFKHNEIDGKALLLLKRDLVLNHMGFKLGPAVKLLEIIDELRIAQDKLEQRLFS